MNILLYSDKNYEYQVDGFIKSLSYSGIKDFKIFYYTIDFKSSIIDDNVITIPWEKNDKIIRFEFYKPSICLDLLKYVQNDIVFFDCDVILSKRFSKMNLVFGLDYPMFCVGPIDYPMRYFGNEEFTIYFNETKLMNYLGVPKRTMNYIMTCFFTYSINSKDFLEEWVSFCENSYLMKDQETYFPFPDETIANVLLWKRNATENYGRRFINTHKFTTFKMCEENDNIIDINIDENMYEYCENSSQIYFYHATKIDEENEKILKYINENSKY